MIGPTEREIVIGRSVAVAESGFLGPCQPHSHTPTLPPRSPSTASPGFKCVCVFVCVHKLKCVRV